MKVRSGWKGWRGFTEGVHPEMCLWRSVAAWWCEIDIGVATVEGEADECSVSPRGLLCHINLHHFGIASEDTKGIGFD